MHRFEKVYIIQFWLHNLQLSTENEHPQHKSERGPLIRNIVEIRPIIYTYTKDLPIIRSFYAGNPTGVFSLPKSLTCTAK